MLRILVIHLRLLPQILVIRLALQTPVIKLVLRVLVTHLQLAPQILVIRLALQTLVIKLGVLQLQIHVILLLKISEIRIHLHRTHRQTLTPMKVRIRVPTTFLKLNGSKKLRLLPMQNQLFVRASAKYPYIVNPIFKALDSIYNTTSFIILFIA